MGNDADAGGVEPNLVAETGGAVLGVGDNRVHRPEDTPGGGRLAAARARRPDVVGGQQPRAARRQQVDVERRNREPLVVDDVGVGGTAEAEHVREVLGGLEGEPKAGVETAAGGAPIEAFIDPVALGRGHRAVEELGRDEFDCCPLLRQSSRKSAIVGRRKRRGIDELDAQGC